MSHPANAVSEGQPRLVDRYGHRVGYVRLSITDSMGLRRVLRAHPSDDERIRKAMIQAMDLKPRGHDFDLGVQPLILRHTKMTGG